MINKFWKVRELLNHDGRLALLRKGVNKLDEEIVKFALEGKEQELKEILGISGATKAEPKKETAPKKAEKPVEKVAEETVEKMTFEPKDLAQPMVNVAIEEPKSEEAPVAKKKGKKNAE